MSGQNIDLIQTFHAALWDNRDLSAIDSIFADDVIINSPLEVTTGTESLKQVMSKWLAAFSDLKVTWDDVITSGDKVICQWQATGTHTGEFKNIKATEKNISYTGCTIYKLDNDKVIEYWSYVDIGNILRQMYSI